MKRITAVILTLAMLCAVSCTGGTNTPNVTTTVGDDAHIVPTETTEITETVTTAPVTTLPEFNMNSEECLMYRLLDMTVEEIEAEFGEMTRYAIIGGGTPCYDLPGYGLRLLFESYPDCYDEPLPRDICPLSIETGEYDPNIYPGIYVGMESNKLHEILGIDSISFSMADFFPGFSSWCKMDGYSIAVLWSIPKERDLEVQKAIFWGTDEEEETAREKLVEDIKSGDANAKIRRITISKAD